MAVLPTWPCGPLSALLVLALAGPALPVTIALPHGPSGASSLSHMVEGMSLTVSGFDTDFDGTTSGGRPAALLRRRAGIGVHGAARGPGIADGEAVMFDFGAEHVALRALAFRARPREMADGFHLFVDGTFVGTFRLGDGEAERQFVSFFFGPGEVTGSTVAIQAVNAVPEPQATALQAPAAMRRQFASSPGFLLANLEVDPLDGPPPDFPPDGVADSPLPASLALLLAALGALRVLRRAPPVP